MLNKIISKIKTRDNGDTTMSLFPLVISIIVILALVVLITSWLANVDTKQNVDQIVRKYTIKLETDGYLSDETQAKLLKELADAGLNNPSCSQEVQGHRTTTERQSYGSKVYLAITGTVTINDPELINGADHDVGGIAKVMVKTSEREYSVLRQTVSKTTAEIEPFTGE